MSFFIFEISLGVRSYVDNFSLIISAGDEPNLKRLLKALHFLYPVTNLENPEFLPYHTDLTKLGVAMQTLDTLPWC
jgi:hypothetical protein